VKLYRLYIICNVVNIARDDFRVTVRLEAEQCRGSGAPVTLIAMTPLGRIGQPSDIAPIAVFLASDEASWLTGEIILASGALR
jgi:NAD(P)-dependent dehydrogenase (short-subunit alcohol dehydrogenase family)